jgi:DNA-binding MurR/RpiR family transcriptional regulator
MENLAKKKTIDTIHEENQPIKIVEKPLDTTENEQVIREKIEFVHMKKNMTMRELSIEIGISQPTLSRFYNKKTKRLSSTARNKLNQWYKRQLIIDKM